jgi:chromosome segregation ATPase
MEEFKMVRRFCWIATTLAVIFALSSIGWSREKPDYLKEKEMMAKPETAEKRDKPMRASKIKDLTQQLEELKAKLERLPAESDEDARHYQERIAEIQMQIAELREKSAVAERRVEREARTMSAKRLPRGEFQERVEQLKEEIEKAKARIHELERTNPDSPKLRELRQYVKERQKRLERLASQSRRQPRPEARRQTQLKIFQLKHIDVEVAFGVVEPFITPNGRGIVVPVFHTNSLIKNRRKPSTFKVGG